MKKDLRMDRPLGQTEAEKSLMIRDLQAVECTFSRTDMSRANREAKEHLKAYVRQLEKYDVDLSDVELFVVDDYPDPYKNLRCWAMNFDSDDAQNFGIVPGIYLKRTFLSPLFSSFLIAHELIHQVFGRIPSGELARGLEDGISDIFGYMLSSATIGETQARNILLNMRFRAPSTISGRLYIEALRQASILYREYGLEGMIQILTNGHHAGRHVIKELEQQCLAGRYSQINLPRGNRLGPLDVVTGLILGFPETMVASPLACLIAEGIKKGDRLPRYFVENRIDVRQGSEAVKELTEQLFVLFIDKDLVVFDETKAYVSTRTLRYRLLD